MIITNKINQFHDRKYYCDNDIQDCYIRVCSSVVTVLLEYIDLLVTDYAAGALSAISIGLTN